MPEKSRITIRGWVYRRRDLGSKTFLVVRDSSGIIQCVFEGDAAREAKNADIEASVVVSGLLRRDARAPGGMEILGEKVTIVGPSHNFPIARDFSREFLLRVRHLSLIHI